MESASISNPRFASIIDALYSCVAKSLRTCSIQNNCGLACGLAPSIGLCFALIKCLHLANLRALSLPDLGDNFWLPLGFRGRQRRAVTFLRARSASRLEIKFRRHQDGHPLAGIARLVMDRQFFIYLQHLLHAINCYNSNNRHQLSSGLKFEATDEKSNRNPIHCFGTICMHERNIGETMSERDLLQVKLNNFYTSTLANIRPLFDDRHLQELSSPLLISISDAYLTAPVRIMFVGKETNGWWDKLGAYYAGEDALAGLMKRYEKQMEMPKWPGRFFPMLGRAARELAGAQADAIAWTNLMRMDWEHGKGYSRNSKGFSDALTKMSQEMLRFEVELLKPDVIIFACGASYDSVIKETFPDRAHSVAIIKRALWQFNVGKILCFRAQHPQAIRKKNSALKPVAAYYADIFALVKANFVHVYSGQGTEVQAPPAKPPA